MKKTYITPESMLLELHIKGALLLPASNGQHTDESLGREADEWDEEQSERRSRRHYNCWEDEELEEEEEAW